MVGDFFKYVAGEWTVIIQAPVLFLGAVVVCTLLVWITRRSIYTGQISSLREAMTSLNERIKLRDDQLESMQRGLAADSPADALVKLGELTEKVEAISIGKWNRLTAVQREKLEKRLERLEPKPICVEVADDARALVASIVPLLEKFGWQIEGVRVIGAGEGVRVYGQGREQLAELLKDVGEFEVHVSDERSDGKLTLFLGVKPF